MQYDANTSKQKINSQQTYLLNCLLYPCHFCSLNITTIQILTVGHLKENTLGLRIFAFPFKKQHFSILAGHREKESSGIKKKTLYEIKRLEINI